MKGRTLICIFFILGFGLSYANCPDTINSGIQKIIDETRRHYNIPAIQVSIICAKDESPRDFVSGYTTNNNDIPIQPNHLFQIGSLTKSFASVLILQLESEGLLSINDSLVKWLPQYPNWNKITIKQLLNHTSGIHDYVDLDAFIQIQKESGYTKQWSQEELLELISDSPPYFKPGQGFHYSDVNYLISSMIIHAVTGKSVNQELHNRLLKVIPLSDSYYFTEPYSKKIIKRMAHGYSKDANGLFTDTTNYNMSAEDMAGAMISTSHDMAIWLKTIITNKAILPEKQRKKMFSLVDDHTGQSLPKDSLNPGYGLGIRRDYDSQGGEIWGHRGATFGYRSNMVWLKNEDVYISIMTSIKTNPDYCSELTNRLVNYIHFSLPAKKTSNKPD